MTKNLAQRVWAHKNKFVEGFTEEYGVDLLVYYEIHDNIFSAIQREKALKHWKRKWKLALIERYNPDWKDLYGGLGGDL